MKINGKELRKDIPTMLIKQKDTESFKRKYNQVLLDIVMDNFLVPAIDEGTSEAFVYARNKIDLFCAAFYE